jgi:hypothetical protein
MSSTSSNWQRRVIQLTMDRLRKLMLKYHTNSDICKYKKQRNSVNNLKKIAKDNFEINLDNIILENASNNKTYWKIDYTCHLHHQIGRGGLSS